MDSMERKCLDCNEILHGRADQKFCCDACRNHFNNRLKKRDNFVRNINNLLIKNRRILAELSRKYKLVHRDVLLQQGFSFTFITGIGKRKKRESTYFCYDYGYEFKKGEKILLVKKNQCPAKDIE
jgi:hypothetical protein